MRTWVVFALLLSGCGDGASMGEPGTGASTEALIGSKCAKNEDCKTFEGQPLFCVTKDDFGQVVWPQGFCTLACIKEKPKCPAGAICELEQTTLMYLCVRGCGDTSHCPEGQTCNTWNSGYCEPKHVR